MSDIARTERLLNMLYTVQKCPGIQGKDLAKIFEKSSRTIQRDIGDLKKMGFNIISSTGAAGGFMSRGSYSLKPLVFSGEEALALFVASRALMEQKGFPYAEDLKSALKKISQVIYEKDEQFFQGLESKTSVILKQLKDYIPWENVFEEINQAILNRLTIEMTYDSYSSQNIVKRKVDPYHMIFREGCWYLIAYCHQREAIRIFRVDRIIDAETTMEEYVLPEDFSLAEYFKDSWQLGKGEQIIMVKILFYPPVSRLIRENTWHPSQKIEELPEGKLIYTARVEGTFEIKRWILGWGAGAECLEPEGLREEIGRELMNSAHKYRRNKR